jgi:hypothetical protein
VKNARSPTTPTKLLENCPWAIPGEGFG